MSDYWTMREIGRAFHTTSHSVGKKLKELGLRTSDGKPSLRAFEAGLCSQRWTQDMNHYCWAWHAKETFRFLREAGFGESEAKGQDRSPA